MSSQVKLTLLPERYMVGQELKTCCDQESLASFLIYMNWSGDNAFKYRDNFSPERSLPEFILSTRRAMINLAAMYTDVLGQPNGNSNDRPTSLGC
jgi:hypothetical protein